MYKKKNIIIQYTYIYTYSFYTRKHYIQIKLISNELGIYELKILNSDYAHIIK